MAQQELGLGRGLSHYSVPHEAPQRIRCKVHCAALPGHPPPKQNLEHRISNFLAATPLYASLRLSATGRFRACKSKLATLAVLSKVFPHPAYTNGACLLACTQGACGCSLRLPGCGFRSVLLIELAGPSCTAVYRWIHPPLLLGKRECVGAVKTHHHGAGDGVSMDHQWIIGLRVHGLRGACRC